MVWLVVPEDAMKRSHRAAGLLLVSAISIPWLDCAT
jgi:hypothetical protein